MKPDEIITYPLMTESASIMVERDNKLVFVVNFKADKNTVPNHCYNHCGHRFAAFGGSGGPSDVRQSYP